jgi:superfamily II DNA/RNA helicase
MIHKLLNNHVDGKIGALVIVPTRELAIQISQHLEGFLTLHISSSLAVYGGNDAQNFVAEKKSFAVRRRHYYLYTRPYDCPPEYGYVSLKGLQFLVLDEADRMLDMGFQDDLNKIIKTLPEKKQTLLFSATMPTKIRQLARNILIDPVEVNIALSRPLKKLYKKLL